MRQHITVDQLLSLTPEQHDRLREWWVPEEWEPCYDGKAIVHVGNPIFAKAEGYLPLLSIGQCWELLANRGVSLDNFGARLFNEPQEFKGWMCLLTKPWCQFEAKEPIDALFAAVKEVI